MRSQFHAAAVIALAAVFSITAWQALVVYRLHGGDWTSRFCSGDRFPPPPDLRARTYLFENSNGYDGQFYRYIAHDPWMRRGFDRFIDDARLRYGRILMPALAHFAGFGSPAGTDIAIVAIVFGSIGLGVYWTALWCGTVGLSPYWGSLFLLTPAVVTSADRMLMDALLCALFAAFAYYGARDKYKVVWVICLLAALTRETGLFLSAAAMVSYACRKQWRRAAFFALAAAPAFLWMAIVASRTPPSEASRIIGWPILGIFPRLLIERPLPGVAPGAALVVYIADVMSIVSLFAVITTAVMWNRWKEPDSLSVAVAFFAVLAACANAPEYLMEAFGFGRPISPLLLWVMIEAARRRNFWAMASPLIINGAAWPVAAWSLARSVGLGP